MLSELSLRNIQSGDDKIVYTEVTKVALFMATGGYLKQANRLLSALWKYKLPHDRSTWLPDIAFTVLWNTVGSHPEVIPFPLDNIDSIERNMRGYIATDKWAYSMPELSWQELRGQDLWRKAIQTARLVKKDSAAAMDLTSLMAEQEGDMDALMAKVGQYIKSTSVEASDSFPSAYNEKEALAMLKKMVAEGFSPFDGLALGAELAARNGERDTAVQFARLWAQNAIQNPAGCNFPLLAASRHVAPMLLEGIVGPDLGLSADSVKEYSANVLTRLDERMTRGRSLVYGKLNWNQLIREISSEALRIEDEEVYGEDVRKSGWIGFEGAIAAEIATVEERLNINLPNDYKQFLETTNGMMPFPILNPPLVGVSQIRYLVDVVEPYFAEIIQNSYIREGDDLRHAVLISNYPDEQLVWLIPIDPEKPQWEMWFYAHWIPGVERFPSFRSYMEDALSRMQTYEPK